MLKKGYVGQPPNTWTIKTIHALRPFHNPQSTSCHHITLSFKSAYEPLALKDIDIMRAVRSFDPCLPSGVVSD